MSNEADAKWTTGLDYDWPQAMVFVIDVELRDRAALDAVHNDLTAAVSKLNETDGVQIADIGLGLAINDARRRVLKEFSSPRSLPAEEQE